MRTKAIRLFATAQNVVFFWLDIAGVIRVYMQNACKSIPDKH